MDVRIMTDSPIRFPGLFGDWAFTGSSVAFHIGGKAIYWYGIIIALGVLLALWFCMHQKEKYGITEDNLMDAVLWGIPLSIVGARLYYVIFYLDRFRREDGSLDWGKTVAIWDGGLAIYGAVIAAFLVGLLLSRKKGFKLGAMTDLVVMGFLIGQAVGRWGNFMNREAFGTETTMPWRMELTTTMGTSVAVHPTFLYESLWNVVGLLLLVFIVARARRGEADAKAALARYAHRLARALAHVINLLDPDVIVLGGGMSNVEELYERVPPQLSAFVFGREVTTPIVRNRHGDSSGVRGAAWLWP